MTIPIKVNFVYTAKSGGRYVIEVTVPKAHSYDDEIEGHRADVTSEGRVVGQGKVIGLSRDSWHGPSAKKAAKYLETFEKRGIRFMVAQMEDDGVFKGIDQQYKQAQTEDDEDETDEGENVEGTNEEDD